MEDRVLTDSHPTTSPSVQSQSLLRRAADYIRYRPSVPQEELTYDERKQSMQKVIVAWCFGAVFFQAIAGTPVVGMFRMLGATPVWIGRLAALMPLAMIAAPVGSYLLARSRSRKRLFLTVSYPGRLVWILIAALGAFMPHGTTTVAILFAFVLFSRLSSALSNPMWFSWASDLVPEQERGTFWGARQMWGRAFSIVTLIALSKYLGTDPPYSRFVVFFTIVSIAGWADIFVHRAVAGVRHEVSEQPPSLREMLLEPVRDPRFRPLLVFVLCSSFANQLGGGMFHLMMLEEMRLSYFEISLYVPGLIGVVWIVGSRYMGRLVDNLREGDRLVLYVCAAGTALVALLWPLTSPRQHPLIALNVIVGGLSWSGYQIAMTALIIGLSPSKSRAAYIGMHGVVFGLGNMLGSLMAGELAEIFAGVAVFWGPLKLTQFRTVYLISGIGRTLSLFLLPMIREPDSRPIGVYVHRLLSLNPFVAGTWVYVREKLGPPNSGNGGVGK